MTEQISAATARRYLAIRHLLAPPRSLSASGASVLAVVDRLGSLQFDPLEVAGRNHDLVLAARIDGYKRSLTDELLYDRRLLFETYNKSLNILPTRELPYYRVAWAHGDLGWAGTLVAEQDKLAGEILAKIKAEGPKSSSDFERRDAIAWWWGPTSAVRAVLEALAVSGRLGLSRREGNRRYYDLVERLYPADLLAIAIPESEQLRHKLLSRYKAHGLLGAGGGAELWPGTGGGARRSLLRAELIERGEIVPVGVEGVRGERYLPGDELPILAQARREVSLGANGVDGAGPAPINDAPPGVAFLAPLDPLMWDRELLTSLYGFEYRWEVYTPAAKRRWGYYVLPILFGDTFVGRIEPRIDRAGKTVRILGLSFEPDFDPLAAPGFLPAFASSLNAYLAFAGADALTPPSNDANKALFDALRTLVALVI